MPFAAADSKLKKLKLAEGAYFKIGDNFSCFKGTRTALIKLIIGWIDGEALADNKIFWLFGMAGSGKSSVANSIAEKVNAGDCCLICFFLKRDIDILSDMRYFIQTLAYRFAERHSEYRARLEEILRDPTNAHVFESDMETQLRLLFEEPLKDLQDPPQLVVVIDALDECKDASKSAEFINKLAELTSSIKIFVTSRDEPAIRNEFTLSANSYH